MSTSGLGSLLVDEGLLTEADRRTIRRTCGTHGAAFARSVIALGLLDEGELAAFLAEKTHWKVAPKNLADKCQPAAIAAVDRPLLERLEVLPFRLEGGTLQVAMMDPTDQDTIRQLSFFTGCKVQPLIATMTGIRAGLAKHLKNYTPATSSLEEFITNHAHAANRRLRLAQKWTEPAPATGEVRSKPAAPAAGGAASGPDPSDLAPDADLTPLTPSRDRKGASSSESATGFEAAGTDAGFDDDMLDHNGPAAAGAGPAAAEDEDLMFEMDPPAAAPAAAAATGDDGLADAAVDPSGDPGDGLEIDFEDGAASDSPPAASGVPATALDQVSLSDDLDLSAFDPDNPDIGGDLGGLGSLEDDLGTVGKPATSQPSTPKAPPIPVVAADGGNAALDEILGDLGTDSPLPEASVAPETARGLDTDLDTGLDLESDLATDPATGAAAEGAKGSGDDLDAGDLFTDADAAAPAEDGGEEEEDPFATTDASSADQDDPFGGSKEQVDAGDELEAAFDGPSAPAGKRERELADALDVEAELTADLSGDLDLTATDPTADAVDSAAAPAALVQDSDPFGDGSAGLDDPGLDGLEMPGAGGDPDLGLTAGSETGETTEAATPTAADDTDGEDAAAVAALNQALMSVTMARDIRAALTRVAPQLHTAGMTHGLLCRLAKGELTPLAHWAVNGEDEEAQVETRAFKGWITPGLKAAAARLKQEFQPVTDMLRDADLKPYTTWFDRDGRAAVMAVKGTLTGGESFVAVCRFARGFQPGAGEPAAALLRAIAGRAA